MNIVSDVVHNQGPPGLEPVSPEAKDLMVKNIPLEYELYNFLLNRLRRQASDLGLTH